MEFKDSLFIDHVEYLGSVANRMVSKFVKESGRRSRKLSDSLNVQAKRNHLLEDELLEARSLLAIADGEIENLLKINQELGEALRTLAGKKSQNPWASQVTVMEYEASDSVSVRFDLCKLPNGEKFLDARKYSNGKPTRKGICFGIENFHEFLTRARVAWSQIDSGIFEYSKKKEEDANDSKKPHSRKNCKGRI